MQQVIKKKQTHYITHWEGWGGRGGGGIGIFGSVLVS